MSTRAWLLVVLGVAALVTGLTVYRLYGPAWRTVAKAPAEAAASASPLTAPSPASVPAPAGSEVLALPAPEQPLAPADIPSALAELVGSKALARFVHTDDFARRFVATVDNLGREHAPAMMWPVLPTPGRFAVDEKAGERIVAADNAGRYTPFVLMVEGIDPARAVDLYARMQPLLQQAYEELGFPQRRFDQRLLQVIDLLLAAPAPAEPVKLTLTEVKGPVPSERPWQRYEFADAALEARPAGQKLMMRIGAVNQRRLKAWLSALRQQLLQRMQAR